MKAILLLVLALSLPLYAQRTAQQIAAARTAQHVSATMVKQLREALKEYEILYNKRERDAMAGGVTADDKQKMDAFVAAHDALFTQARTMRSSQRAHARAVGDKAPEVKWFDVPNIAPAALQLQIIALEDELKKQ